MPINSFLYPAKNVPVVYEVANSLRFNNDSSDNLSRTPSSASNRRTFTFSTWFKLSGTDGSFISAGTDISNGPLFIIDILSGGNEGILRIEDTVSGNNVIALRTTRKFRDPSAWINIVVAIDTTQSTASDRVKLYINGTQETSFLSSYQTYPTQNLELAINNTHEHRIGTRAANTSGKFFDGYMCETVLIDGSQLDPTSFGEFDSDSPRIWKPKDVSGLTFGTYGFYLDFKDSSNLGNDANGGTDFTETNLDATDQATDTCTNNFCTANPLDQNGSYTLSQGNCQLSSGHTSWFNIGSTIAVANGKWYWEVEFDAGTMIEIMVGIHDTSVNRTDTNSWVTGSTLFYNDSGGEIRTDGTDSTANYGTLSAGDILGIALNMDDKQITLLKNGSAIASNVAISTSITEAIPTFLTDANNVVFKVNFGGSPSFTVSSGNADGEGYGNFEFAPPSGYFSLCTKNLAEYG